MPLDDKLAYFDRITGDRNFYSTFYLQINDLATTLAMKYPHDPRVVKLYGDHLIASGQLDDALTYYKTHKIFDLLEPLNSFTRPGSTTSTW